MTCGSDPRREGGTYPGADGRRGWQAAASPGASLRRVWLRRAKCARGAAPEFSTAADGVRSPRLARLEAALFVSERPLSARRLAQHAALADAAEVDALVAQLNGAYERDGSPFRVELVATGYQLFTRPEFAPWLDRVHARHERLRLSPPALETLAIVAYRQPVTRADIEAVRGVQSGEMLKQLMERGLVRIAGEDESLGRPYLYGTTRQFLELFGLHELADLPHAKQLRPAEDAGQECDEPFDAHVAA